LVQPVTLPRLINATEIAATSKARPRRERSTASRFRTCSAYRRWRRHRACPLKPNFYPGGSGRTALVPAKWFTG